MMDTGIRIYKLFGIILPIIVVVAIFIKAGFRKCEYTWNGWNIGTVILLIWTVGSMFLLGAAALAIHSNII